jgi:hypothetical protein
MNEQLAAQFVLKEENEGSAFYSQVKTVKKNGISSLKGWFIPAAGQIKLSPPVDEQLAAQFVLKEKKTRVLLYRVKL